MSEATVCVPNITGPGRRRRRNVAIVLLAVAAALFAWLVVSHAGAGLRTIVGLPLAGAAITYLQVTRNTCIKHAQAGTIEHDDFSTTPAPEDQLAASRRVANTILRDGALVGVVTALIAGLTTFVI